MLFLNKCFSLPSGIAGALTTGLALKLGLLAPLQGNGRYEVLTELADHLTVEYLDDHAGGVAKTFRFTGVNVQIVNGLGATNGNPSAPFEVREGMVSTNSVGNLIIGYQEDELRPHPRTGSHNIIVGPGHGHESFGCLVTGARNSSTSPYSAVLGGEMQRARGPYATIVGGFGHSVGGPYAVAIGGYQNSVGGPYALCAGGRHSIVTGSHGVALGGSHANPSGWLSTVVGGTKNEAQGTQSVVSGGFRNLASGWRATVNGGEHNTASGDHSSVAFGLNRSVSRANQSGNTDHDGVAGSLWEDH